MADLRGPAPSKASYLISKCPISSHCSPVCLPLVPGRDRPQNERLIGRLKHVPSAAAAGGECALCAEAFTALSPYRRIDTDLQNHKLVQIHTELQ